MRQISIKLDNSAEQSLEKLLAKNDMTISNIVNIAIISLEKEGIKLELIDNNTLYQLIKTKLKEQNSTIEQYCEYRVISKQMLQYVCRQLDNNKIIKGFGNYHNKWRDKEDGRLFKTHTAWIAHCLKEDFCVQI